MCGRSAGEGKAGLVVVEMRPMGQAGLTPTVLTCETGLSGMVPLTKEEERIPVTTKHCSLLISATTLLCGFYYYPIT